VTRPARKNRRKNCANYVLLRIDTPCGAGIVTRGSGSWMSRRHRFAKVGPWCLSGGSGEDVAPCLSWRMRSFRFPWAGRVVRGSTRTEPRSRVAGAPGKGPARSDGRTVKGERQEELVERRSRNRVVRMPPGQGCPGLALSPRGTGGPAAPHLLPTQTCGPPCLSPLRSPCAARPGPRPALRWQRSRRQTRPMRSYVGGRPAANGAGRTAPSACAHRAYGFGGVTLGSFVIRLVGGLRRRRVLARATNNL